MKMQCIVPSLLGKAVYSRYCINGMKSIHIIQMAVNSVTKSYNISIIVTIIPDEFYLVIKSVKSYSSAEVKPFCFIISMI